MHPRFAKLPTSLTERSRTVRLQPGNIPALLCHPDWISPAPTVIWMHGRTANKELDSGRYIRWLKSGIAAVAFDLPEHGERGLIQSPRGHAGANGAADNTGTNSPTADNPAHTLSILAQTIKDIDLVVEALADPIWQGVFDLDRLGLGGMSLGGMATLRRLCEPPHHDFHVAAVECTTGDLWSLYRPEGPKPWGQTFTEPQVAPLDPLRHINGFKPIPLLALHSEADRIVPWSIQQNFLNQLRHHYATLGADPALIHQVTWPTTGAPQEHSGFGRVSNEAKNIQTEFLKKHLSSDAGK